MSDLPAYPPYGSEALPVDHPDASKARTLGVVAVVCLVLTPFLCLPLLPLAVTGPMAWSSGRRARREIDAAPDQYRNRGDASAGLWLGAVSSVLGAIGVLAVAALVITIGVTGWSLV